MQAVGKIAGEAPAKGDLIFSEWHSSRRRFGMNWLVVHGFRGLKNPHGTGMVMPTRSPITLHGTRAWCRPNPFIRARPIPWRIQLQAQRTMHVERTRHIDASEPDEAGMHEYYYEYDIYRFIDGAVSFAARSYTDQPGEAHFLGIQVNGQDRSMVDADLAHPLFLAAQAYLRGEGKIELNWLSGRGNGYEPVPFPR